MLVVFFVTCCKDDTPEIELAVIKTIEVADLMYNQVTVASSVISNGGDSISESGVCWSKQPNPTITDFVELNIDNNVNDFSVELKNLESNTQYYVRSYAVNRKGLAYGEELTFTLWLNKPEEPITDIDNNSYSTIRIGDQVWMKENLKVTHYRNGDAISHITLQNDAEWLQTTAGAYCSYNDDQALVSIYGYLYNGYAVTDARRICPEGWHIPTKEEWRTLTNYLGGYKTSGNLIKASSNYWDDLNPNTSNLSGFSALPGGMRMHARPDRTYTEYWGINEEAYMATSDEYIYKDIYYMWYANVANLYEWARVSDNTIKTCGQSVRCIKD
jgi:uncharacterized protein (TIGR02145 family)